MRAPEAAHMARAVYAARTPNGKTDARHQCGPASRAVGLAPVVAYWAPAEEGPYANRASVDALEGARGWRLSAQGRAPREPRRRRADLRRPAGLERPAPGAHLRQRLSSHHPAD